MLSLFRKHRQEVVLKTSDGNVTIQVRREPNGVYLGIDAPECVQIIRGELLSEKVKSPLQASKSPV